MCLNLGGEKHLHKPKTSKGKDSQGTSFLRQVADTPNISILVSSAQVSMVQGHGSLHN
jgi:hypothetical protein